MKWLLVLCILLPAASAFSFSGQRRQRRPKYAPAGPINNKTVDLCYGGDVKFVADAANLCWYWECVETVLNDDINIQLLPRRCALGSKMPYSYDLGTSNPCTVNFNTKISFECTRAQDYSIHQEPECFKDYVCYNNGTATFDGPVCWCECPEEWSGNFDCSEPKQKPAETNVTANATECFQKEPPCDLAGGCENNGQCHNLCGDFWCECPAPFTNGKRCEGFSCDTNPCNNGGTCNRGESGISEVSHCICPPGFYGFLCEFGRASVRSTTARAATLPPTTQPLVTFPPASQPSATFPPTTQRFSTFSTTTQRPTTFPPVTHPITTQRPVTTWQPILDPRTTQTPPATGGFF